MDSAVLISPHLDDAILSAHHVLAANPSIQCWTVFSGRPSPAQHTDWDKSCGFNDSDEALAARLIEEENAFAELPNPRRYFTHLDLQYRSAVADLADVAEALQQWADDAAGPRLIVLPVGAGLPPADADNRPGVAARVRDKLDRVAASRHPRPQIRAHPDHLAVRNQLLATALRSGAVVAFYEDLPYLLGKAGKKVIPDIKGLMGPRRRRLRITHTTVAGDAERKATAIACYTSQIAGISAPGYPLDQPSTHTAPENYWIVHTRRSSG
ncbi:MAG: hypothetical protein CSB46_09000 [Micrococcales bacterium]|nr:MAG: hypothetical protein CSB46_09000 [Micrococcales bacterium]